MATDLIIPVTSVVWPISVCSIAISHRIRKRVYLLIQDIYIYIEDYSGESNDQVNFVDPLADAKSCKRDIPYLQRLRTNTIRVYAIDPKKDHSECMNALSDAGIYVLLDLSTPSQSIIRDQPSWNGVLFDRYVSVVDAMAGYSNVLGFFAGNEVSNEKNNTEASAYVKAAVRDMKSYIRARNYRPMGVGYAANDDASIRMNMANYFDCSSVDDSIDFWGYNIYSWCANSSYHESGFDERTEEFRNYTVPVFFAEYGCNAVRPRRFTEVNALYSDPMADVWSGGIVYMYFQETNDYGIFPALELNLLSIVPLTYIFSGLVSVNGDSVSTLDDFNSLSKEIAAATPSGVGKDRYLPTNTVLQPCPTLDDDWHAAATPLPPGPNKNLCDCMEASLSCTLKPSVPDTKLNTLFGIVCGYGVCSGIENNATSGYYGAYSVCSPRQQLSHVFNRYYNEQITKGHGASACNFGGAASTKPSSKPTGTCSTLLKEAGVNGTGHVSSSPTVFDDPSVTLDVAGGASSSEGSAPRSNTIMHDSDSFRTLQLGLFILLIATGAGMAIM